MLNFSSSAKIRICLQSEAAECGLACIAMIAGYHGYRASLSELRGRFAISLKGATLKAVIAIADSLGLTSRPVKVDLSELGALRLPCILHWDLTHYVVLSRINSRGAEIYDPARGVRMLAVSELSRHFTGVALELTPARSFEKRRTVERVRLADLWSRARGFSSSILQILAMSVLLEAFGLLSPLLNQMIVDNAVAAGDLDLLNVVIIGATILLFIQVVTATLRNYVQMHFSTHLTFQMRGNLLRHVLRLPVAWFEKRHLGNIMSRFGSLQPVQDLLAGSIISVTLDGAMTLITLAVMLAYSPLLSGIILGSLALFIAVRLGTFPRLRHLSLEAIEYQARLDSIFLETIRGARAFKLFGRERERHAVWQNAYADAINAGLSIQRLGIKGGSGLSLLNGIEALLVFYLGAKSVIQGNMTLGMLMAFQSFSGQFSGSFLSLVNQFFRFRMLDLHLERLADIIHQDTEDGLDVERLADRPLRGAIEVKGLSFRYADHEPWILRDVNLTIEPGSFVAFVGPSGGGKSTLLKLLMGLHPPTEGVLLVDEVPLQAFGIRPFRERIGVVMQDDQLFSGTIADNIAFFDPDPDLARVEEVAGLASVHDEIMRMPMGYMTLVGDLGSTLSGGQQQRVLLARALYRRPSVLFLDEGTANLDMLAERRIMQVFKQLQITRVVVAHRPSAIEGADLVFSVERGEVRVQSREIATESLALVESVP